MSDTKYCKECGTHRYYGDNGYHDFIEVHYDLELCSQKCVNKYIIKLLMKLTKDMD